MQTPPLSPAGMHAPVMHHAAAPATPLHTTKMQHINRQLAVLATREQQDTQHSPSSSPHPQHVLVSHSSSGSTSSVGSAASSSSSSAGSASGAGERDGVSTRLRAASSSSPHSPGGARSQSTSAVSSAAGTPVPRSPAAYAHPLPAMTTAHSASSPALSMQASPTSVPPMMLSTAARKLRSPSFSGHQLTPLSHTPEVRASASSSPVPEDHSSPQCESDGTFTVNHVATHASSLRPHSLAKLPSLHTRAPLTHSKTLPTLSSLASSPPPPAHHRVDTYAGYPALHPMPPHASPTLMRAHTTSPQLVCTKQVETGLTDDGYVHINQYIVEMSSRRRQAMARREAAQRARAQRRAARLSATHSASPHSHSSSAAASPAADAVPSSSSSVADASDSESEGGSASDDAEIDDFSAAGDSDDEDASILGRGSYGVVKKVFNSLDARFYAMKIMSRQRLARGRAFGRGGANDGLEAIKREVAIMKKLDHPNIVRLVEVLCDSASDCIYLVMEFAEQGPVMEMDLDDGEVEIAPGQFNVVAPALPLNLARRYFRDVLQGLEYLHHQKVIHRDIKPENLLVDASGRAMLADFGVSTLCEGDECLIASTAGTGVFMSPEMVSSGSKSRGFGGPATDVWSLGVTLYFLVYGRLPWYARALPEIYRLIVEAPLEFPSGPAHQHIPECVRELLRRMLDKNPRTRITVQEMLAHEWVKEQEEEDRLAFLQWQRAQQEAQAACQSSASAAASTSAAAHDDPSAPLHPSGVTLSLPSASACVAYKNRPPVCDTLCPKDIAAALGESSKRPLAQLQLIQPLPLPLSSSPSSSAASTAAGSIPSSASTNGAVLSPNTVLLPAAASGPEAASMVSKLRARLAAWKRELVRKCDANKEAKARKRKTLTDLKAQLAQGGALSQKLKPQAAQAQGQLPLHAR